MNRYLDDDMVKASMVTRLRRAAHGQHPGILIVRADNDPHRDMRDADIARAIGNLELARAPVANEFHILNHWR
jgi:hypothetical protein